MDLEKYFQQFQDNFMPENFSWRKGQKEVIEQIILTYFDKQYNNKVYYYDFKYKDKIIEFNGDLFYANPSIYKDYSCPDFYHPELKAKDIWKKDRYKLDFLKKLDIKYLVIWEFEYKKAPDNIVKQCINFLNS